MNKTMDLLSQALIMGTRLGYTGQEMTTQNMKVTKKITRWNLEMCLPTQDLRGKKLNYWKKIKPTMFGGEVEEVVEA